VRGDPAHKSRIKVGYEVRREQDYVVVVAYKEQQHRARLIYAYVGGTRHIGDALAEQRVGFVKKYHAFFRFGVIKQRHKVF